MPDVAAIVGALDDISSTAINPDISDGLLWGGADQFGKQAAAVAVVAVFAFTVTYTLGNHRNVHKLM